MPTEPDGPAARPGDGGGGRESSRSSGDAGDSLFARYRALLGPVTVVLLFVIGMWWSPFEPHPLPADPSGTPGGEVTWADEDWAIFTRAVRDAVDAGADTLPMGDLMVHIGRGLVGTPYAPGTLEVEGPERLVIELGALDCVTFVENVYAMAAAVKAGVATRLDERGEVEGEYERMLRALRYRGNVIAGYPSRLHYFSEWILDAQAKGLVEVVTEELGGVMDREPVFFMSANPDAYSQLSDPENVEIIRRVEELLSQRGRYVIPEERIGEAASGIRDGDIIAATSTVEGLDVAHTGLAIHVDGVLHLLHAPLVGDSVEISERSLERRILEIEGQDGIMVARPLEPRAASRMGREGR